MPSGTRHNVEKTTKRVTIIQDDDQCLRRHYSLSINSGVFVRKIPKQCTWDRIVLHVFRTETYKTHPLSKDKVDNHPGAALQCPDLQLRGNQHLRNGSIAPSFNIMKVNLYLIPLLGLAALLCQGSQEGKVKEEG